MRRSAIRRDSLFDATFAALRDPYRYISRRAHELGSDVFETRLLLQRTQCMTGRAAAQVFYDPKRFVRDTAAPRALRATLFGEGGVQGLDGAEHAQRKQMFLSLVTPDRIEELAEIASAEWGSAALRWRSNGGVVLYTAAQEIFTRAVCRWADRREDPLGAWIRQLEARRGRNRTVVALANKMTRIAWTILTKGGVYRTPALAATA